MQQHRSFGMPRRDQAGIRDVELVMQRLDVKDVKLLIRGGEFELHLGVAAARFHVTGTGKLRRMKGNRGHMRRKKSGSVKRLYKKKLEMAPGDAARIRRLIQP